MGRRLTFTKAGDVINGWQLREELFTTRFQSRMWRAKCQDCAEELIVREDVILHDSLLTCHCKLTRQISGLPISSEAS